MDLKIDRRALLRLTAAGLVSSHTAAALATQPAAKPVQIGVIGTGSRGKTLLHLAVAAGVEVPAVCDIDPVALDQSMKLVAEARGGHKPAAYSEGPEDYRRLLARDDVDAVIVAAPIQWHAAMSIEAMKAGKHVLSEVAPALTMDECWALVRTTEETGKLYMLAENCCYYDDVMAIRNIVRGGLFGELTYAECGYVHACLDLLFDKSDRLTWRGELARDCAGAWYPTHQLGPVAHWLGINRGDRMVSLMASSTGNASLRHYIRQRFPAGHPARDIKFKGADSVTVLINTAKGVLIDLRFDTCSPRPVTSTTYFSLQGTKGSYESRTNQINLHGRSPHEKWEPVDKYVREFEDPLWKTSRTAAAGTTHGGGDYFTITEFIKMVRQSGPSPIDCYDAAAWGSILPLSAKSIEEGGKLQAIPDFTSGKWETRSS
jgi:predicted dehydrogenase